MDLIELTDNQWKSYKNILDKELKDKIGNGIQVVRRKEGYIELGGENMPILINYYNPKKCGLASKSVKTAKYMRLKYHTNEIDVFVIEKIIGILNNWFNKISTY